MVFTPTYEVKGVEQMRPETRAAIEALRVPDGVELRWVIGRENPFPFATHRNVLAQYRRARAMALEEGYDALWTVEHDMVVPPDAVEKLMGAGADVVYGVYLLRHGSYVLNAWEYIGEQNLGASLTIRPGAMAQAREQGWIRVCGCGWGCTWIARRVLERFEFHDDGGDNPAGDLAFAKDMIRNGVVCVARLDVACDHFDGELRLRPFGGAVDDKVAVTALKDVVAPGGVALVKGRGYELPRGVASELARAGYVEEVGGQESAPELAVVAPAAEKATKPRGRRKGGL